MKRNRWSIAATVGAVLVAGVVACHDSTSPVAKSLAVVGGDNQTIIAGTPSLTPLVVGVTDQHGLPVSGTIVSWSITNGDGALSATTTTTGADGDASVTYTAGPNAGAVSVAAKVEGLDAVTFELAVTDTTSATPAVRLPAVVITAPME